MIVPMTPAKKPAAPVTQADATPADIEPPSTSLPEIDWHAKVLAAIDIRYEYLAQIEAVGEDARQLELQACACDPVYFINNWVWMLDPREHDMPTMPFILWLEQQGLVRWVQEREREKRPGVVEKCRDWGVSVIMAAYILHGWLFRRGFIAGFGSRKDEYVDKLGDLRSIFEKIRFIIEHLPRWMLPVGFDRRRHDKLKAIVNPAADNAIIGESGDGIGRGGRSAIYCVDESAFIERPELLERSLFGNTDVRIDVSTPNGPGTLFAKKCQGGKIARFECDWKADPRKNRKETLPDGRVVYPWYEKQKQDLDPVTLAQEVDRDHNASVEGICIPASWVRAAVELPLQKGGWGPTCAGLDIAEEGKDVSVWMPRYGPMIGDPVDWKKALTTETAYRAKELTEKQKMPALMYDATGVGLGVKGVLQRTEDKLTFRAVAVSTGAAPTDAVWPDGKTSKERFANLRAELWWIARTRFEKAYEFRELGVPHPPEDMISIPNHPQLIQELSMPLVEYTETGKIRIEAKKAMQKRVAGKSPDFADALMLTMFPVPRKAGVW